MTRSEKRAAHAIRVQMYYDQLNKIFVGVLEQGAKDHKPFNESWKKACILGDATIKSMCMQNVQYKETVLIAARKMMETLDTVMKAAAEKYKENNNALQA